MGNLGQSMRLWGVCLLSAGVLLAAGPELDRARSLYQRTEYNAVLNLLIPLAEKDGPTWELIGKAWYMLGEYKKASASFEKAVAADPGNSEYHHWLGKASGKRAETSSVLTAPGHASRARSEFEKAVELHPRNGEAINDLFEFYLEAPGFLGGGLEKAAALVRRIGELDPAERHYAEARLAEKRKQFATAEQQFRQAVELAPRQIGRLIDLAKFLAKQRRYEESEAAFRQAEQIAPNNPKLLFERAAAYIQAGRNLEEARKLLQEYLKAPLTPDLPARSEAEQLLKQAS